MNTQNTYDRQTATFIATLCQNIPDMSGDVMQGWIENSKGLQKVLRETLCPPQSESESSLQNISITLSVPKQSQCTAANCFADKSIFVYRDPNFDSLLPQTMPASQEVKVSGVELTKTTTEAELAKIGNHFTNLSQIENLILRTKNAENTGLITNGYANIFFLQVGVSVFTVLARRLHDGWYVYLCCFRAGNECHAGHRFFSSAT